MENKQHIYDLLRVELFQFLKNGYAEHDDIVQYELGAISNRNIAFAHYTMSLGYDAVQVVLALAEKFD